MILIIRSLNCGVTWILFKEGKILDFLKIKRRTGTIFELKSFVRVIAAPANATLPPRYRHTDAASATKAAIAAVFILFGLIRSTLDILHKLLYFQILLPIILYQMIKGCDPSLLDELIIASELPRYLLLGVFGWKVVVFTHRTVSYILFLHHISYVEVNREERRRNIESIHSLNVHYVNRAFGKLVW